MPRELSPSDRVLLRGRADLMAPGCCNICGAGDHPEGFIDIQVYVEYEGQTYFCMTCAEQIGEVAGMLTRAETKQLTTLSGELAEAKATLETELENANARLSAYDVLLASALANVDSVVTDDAGDVEESGAVEGSTSTEDGASVNADDPGTEAGDSVVSESVKDEGVTESLRTESGNGITL